MLSPAALSSGHRAFGTKCSRYLFPTGLLTVPDRKRRIFVSAPHGGKLGLMATTDFRTDADLSCRAAEEFVNLYYETIDKRRRQLTKLYMNSATLVWNGNPISGQEALVEFFEMLPSSEFQVSMFDCQPVHEQATQGQKTVLVVAHGSVKFEGNKHHYFNQNFLLTLHTTPANSVWKIASDCFRFQDWAS